MNLFSKWLRVLTLVIAPLFFACASNAGKDTAGTTITGIGHYGKKIGIPEFYVNGGFGGNVMGWGGGGSFFCCVSLPRHPDKPVMVTVKWRTMRSNVGEEAWHEQTVPVNYAEKELQYLYVHFLPGHQVVVWSSFPGPASTLYKGPAYPRGPAPDYAPLSNEKPQTSAETKP